MNTNNPNIIKAVEKPDQFDRPQFSPQIVEASGLIRAAMARQKFNVTGNGLTVAVLDTGLNSNHVDFTGKVPTQQNFTSDNGGIVGDATDGNGHGTNVGGIIVADGDHTGIAPGAQIIPLKVLSNVGHGDFNAVTTALQWVIDNSTLHNISAVCMSLGEDGNYTNDNVFPTLAVADRIKALHNLDIPVCIAAGNNFFSNASTQGMSFPAIVRESVSVGAVYDANVGGPIRYFDGAEATATDSDRITPFSQRLHDTVSADYRTDIFAPGAPVTSSGIGGPNGESSQSGTSQATPVTVGAILLIQEYVLRLTGTLPSVDQLKALLRENGNSINDGDNEFDNVTNTGLNFIRLDVFRALFQLENRDKVKPAQAAVLLDVLT